MKNLFVDARLTAHVVWGVILKTNLKYVFVGLFLVILFVLQWLFNLDQLSEVVFGDNPLSFADRLDFLIDGFINIFRLADDFTPIAMITIALMQAVTLTLILGYRSKKQMRKSQGLAIGLSLAGVGCVACGGSILSPLLGLVAANLSISVAQSISDALLAIALVLSYVSMSKTALLTARAISKS